jgi:hypothetical protein
MTALLLALALAASTPTPRWAAIHSADYQVRVPAGQTVSVAFPAPARLVAVDRPVTFTWRIIRPVPAPNFVILEHCAQPERCYPAVMRPNGESSGSLSTPVRVINRSRQDIEVLFRYTIWEAR